MEFLNIQSYLNRFKISSCYSRADPNQKKSLTLIDISASLTLGHNKFPFISPGLFFIKAEKSTMAMSKCQPKQQSYFT